MTHPSSRRAGYAAVLGGCFMLFAGEARADGAASRLHLQYEAPSGCPSRQELLAALDARIQTSWVKGSDTRSFDVRVTRNQDGSFMGRLEIVQPERPPSTREIRGESCKAVTTSLAVFIAIAVDPESDANRTEEPPPDEHGSDSDVGGSSAAKDEIASEPPRPPKRRPPSPLEPEPAPTVWTWRTGYAPNYVPSPRPAWGHRLHAELGWGKDGARLIPAVRLSWGWADFSTFPPLAGEARFRRKTVRLEGCARYALPPFSGFACVGLDAGTLTATAPELPRFFQVTTRWTSATGALRAAWSLVPWLDVEAGATLLAPFERPQFTVQEPKRLVHRPPAVLVEGSLGVGVTARFQ